MKLVLLVGVVAAFAAPGAAAQRGSFSLPPARTLATVPRSVESFGQDGNHLVWARTGDCGKNVELRTLSTGASKFLDAPKGPMCELTLYAGGLQPPMALAGTRALWAYMTVSLSHYNFSLFSAAPGDRGERDISGMSVEGGLEDDGSALPVVPIAGHGGTLVFADINTDGGSPSGVYRVVGKRIEHVAGTERAFAVAVAGSRFALARSIPGGCICNNRPAWSSDGRQIAFVSRAAQEARSQLFVMNADGTRVHRIIDDVADYAWAPDGAAIAVWQYSPGATDRIVIVNADGSGAHAVASGGEVAWAPDGRRLAYTTETGPMAGHVFVLAVEGGPPVDLGEGSGTPKWSPDSKRIAVTGTVGDQTHTYVVDVASRARADLGLGAWPSWAPSGSAVAIGRPDDGVYVAAADGSGVRRIASTKCPYPEWSPDGRWIAFACIDQGGLWIVDPDGGPPRTVVQGDVWDSDWSPDSRSIAFADAGKSAVTILDVATGALRATAADAGAPVSWSPDGTRVLYVVPKENYGDGEIGALDLRGGAAATLTATQPAPDRVVVEIRGRGGKLQSTFDAPSSVRGLAWGGSRFALLIGRSNARSTIEIRSTGGKLLRGVDVARPNYDDLSMSGRWVVFQSGRTGWLVDAITGTTRVLVRAQGRTYLAGLSIDGRRVAWAESTSRKSRIRAVLLPR